MAGEGDLFGDGEGAPSGFFDAVAAAGERKGIGRPKGAANRHTAEFEKWYYARGFKDPAQLLGELVSTDPRALQAMAIENAAAVGLTRTVGTGEEAHLVLEVPGLIDLVDLQRRAAVDLLPYLHGKMPTRIEIADERLPTLIVVTDTNQLDEARQLLEHRQALSAGQLLEPGETPAIPGFSEGDDDAVS